MKSIRQASVFFIIPFDGSNLEMLRTKTDCVSSGRVCMKLIKFPVLRSRERSLAADISITLIAGRRTNRKRPVMSAIGWENQAVQRKRKQLFNLMTPLVTRLDKSFPV